MPQEPLPIPSNEIKKSGFFVLKISESELLFSIVWRTAVVQFLLFAHFSGAILNTSS